MATLDDVLNQLASPRQNTPGAVAAQLASTELGSGVRSLAGQVDLLRSLFQTQTTTTRENTEALQRATQTQGAGASFASTAANVARTAGGALGGGTLLSPVLGGLLRLFGVGGRPTPPEPLPTFSLPRPVTLDGMIQANGTSALATTQYAQDGLPRAVSPAPPANRAVTVNINALDSRSFLDHSDDIARAVRQAMLDSHSLNDVIAEI